MVEKFDCALCGKPAMGSPEAGYLVINCRDNEKRFIEGVDDQYLGLSINCSREPRYHNVGYCVCVSCFKKKAPIRAFFSWIFQHERWEKFKGGEIENEILIS